MTGRSCEVLDRYPYGTESKLWPVSESQVRLQLQLTHNEDDELVFGPSGLLAQATNEVENRGNVSLIKQKRVLVLGSDGTPDVASEFIPIPYGPVVELLAVKYLDSESIEQTMPGAAYRLVKRGLFHGIQFSSDIPEVAEGPGSIWAEFESGFGIDVASIPPAWVACVSMLASRLYDLRDGSSGNATADAAWDRTFDRKIVIAGGSRRYA